MPSAHTEKTQFLHTYSNRKGFLWNLFCLAILPWHSIIVLIFSFLGHIRYIQVLLISLKFILSNHIITLIYIILQQYQVATVLNHGLISDPVKFLFERTRIPLVLEITRQKKKISTRNWVKLALFWTSEFNCLRSRSWSSTDLEITPCEQYLSKGLYTSKFFKLQLNDLEMTQI